MDARRVVISGVTPEIDAGRFPIKRVIGEQVIVEANIFAEGHDALSAVLRFRHDGAPDWDEIPMLPLVNDRWRSAFHVEHLGHYRYTIEAWVDHYGTWRRDLSKRLAAAQDVAVDVLIGAELIEHAANRAGRTHARLLTAAARDVRDRGEIALTRDIDALVARYPDRTNATSYALELGVIIDPVLARYSTWYELFPRSFGETPNDHGTLRDVERQLPQIANMGFDVMYLPPVHPIGITHRKGKNNAVVAEPDDVGSPWAIGAVEGGHDAVHPDLGTVADFEHLVTIARGLGIEIALDLALQCSPDHPYVRDHPQWFRHRPDGTIQYAENPPKKYQDIYPLDFESADWRSLWEELRRVVFVWIERGVRIFRVDNPHTKPFAFWEWLIADVKTKHPDAIFLSEAFTRPRVMQRLAKVGFTQSYTYFAWRNTSAELTRYLTELTTTEVKEYLRPNLWTNTQDILTEYLQLGGRPAFVTRFVLAATLGASYGIYGPAFDFLEAEPREPGSEEYRDSEKYQLRAWDRDRPNSLRELITRVNTIRREHPALQTNTGLRFHPTTNDLLLCYSKTTDDLADALLIVVNVDPHHVQTGWIELPLAELGLESDQPFQVHDLLGGARYLWNGSRNYVELNPHLISAHIFQIRRRTRREHDFEYYL